MNSNYNIIGKQSMSYLENHLQMIDTDGSTLDVLSGATTGFGNSLRRFKERTCEVFPTCELEHERAGQMQHQAKSLANAVQGAADSKSKKLA